MRCVVIAAVLLLACSKRDAPDVAAPAGKVVELTGKVSASRGGSAARPLAVADQVFPDDMIDTGADGSVTIELSHNHARWAMEPGQKKRVDESAAFKLAAQEQAGVVDHTTSAAGRNAERTAAENRATSGVMDSPPAPEPKADVKAEPDRQKTATQPPPPPPPPPTARGLEQGKTETKPQLPADREAPKGGGAGDGAVASVPPQAPGAAVVLAGKRTELAACLNAGEKATVTIEVVKGKATAVEKDKKRKTCLDAALAKIELPLNDKIEKVSLELAR